MISRIRAIFFPFFNVLLNGFNFFFHIAASWYLTGVAYGQANALLALFALLSVLGLSIQLLTAKVVSKEDRTLSLKQLPLGSLLIKTPIILSLASCIILLMLLPVLRSILGVDTGSLLLLYILVFLHTIVSMTRGDMQGKERMLALNINYYIEVLGKLTVFFILAASGFTLKAVLIGSCAGMLLSLIHGWLFSIRQYSNSFTTQPTNQLSGIWKSLGQDFTDSLITNLFVLFFISIDMIVVQHYFPAQSSGYAIALKYSQLVYYVSYSLIAAFIPKLGANGANKKGLRQLIGIYSGLMFCAAICVYIGTTFIFPISIPVLFGATYQSAEQYLVLGGWVYWLFSIVLFFVHVHVLIGRRKFMWGMLAGAILLLISFGSWHTSPQSFLYAELCLYSVLAIYFIIDAWMYLYPRQTIRSNSVQSHDPTILN